MNAILFDLDGVLLVDRSARAATGQPLEEAATARALRDLDVEAPPRRFLKATRYDDYPKLTALVERFDLPVDPRNLWIRRAAHLSRLEREALETGQRGAYPDVDVLERLADTYDLGVVSNAREETVRHALDYLGNAGLMDVVRAQRPDPEDWQQKKPAPTYLTDALDELSTTNALYVGDSESDVVAAVRAGIDSVLLRRSHNGHLEPEPQPQLELDGLDALLDV